jgi:hypothetical protein
MDGEEEKVANERKVQGKSTGRGQGEGEEESGESLGMVSERRKKGGRMVEEAGEKAKERRAWKDPATENRKEKEVRGGEENDDPKELGGGENDVQAMEESPRTKLPTRTEKGSRRKPTGTQKGEDRETGRQEKVAIRKGPDPGHGPRLD